MVSAAAAVGQFVYPFIIPPLVNQYGWRGSMIILSGLILHICIAAMVVKPQSQPHTTQPKSELIEKDESKISEELMDKNTDNKEVETDEQEGMLKMSKELLCDLRFNIFSMLTFLYMAGSSVAYSYIAGYAKTMGIDEQRADLLVSIARGFSLGGRSLFFTVHLLLFDMIINESFGTDFENGISDTIPTKFIDLNDTFGWQRQVLKVMWMKVPYSNVPFQNPLSNSVACC